MPLLNGQIRRDSYAWEKWIGIFASNVIILKINNKIKLSTRKELKDNKIN
jgi:hypothetical protein